jgi:hypothetical protein
VDKDVIITLGEVTSTDVDEFNGNSYSSTYKAATLKLSKGWNTLQVEDSGTTQAAADGSGTRTDTLSLSVGNPDLKWVLYE